MALSGGHSATVADDEAAILSGRCRVKSIPPSALIRDNPSTPQLRRPGNLPGLLRSGSHSVSGLLSRLVRVLPRPRRTALLNAADVLPGRVRRRERRWAEAQAAEVEQVVLGAPARGWPREDVPGLFSALSWLVSRMAVGGLAAALVAPIGPVAAMVAKFTTRSAGGRLGYKFGRRLDRIEVAHVQQYLQDVRDAAAAGMSPEACIEYAAMCDAGPFSPEDDICRWRPLWAPGHRRRGVGSGDVAGDGNGVGSSSGGEPQRVAR